jgi:hypothetical protein
MLIVRPFSKACSMTGVFFLLAFVGVGIAIGIDSFRLCLDSTEIFAIYKQK